MTERIGIYPGSFDPPTRGHEDIARRALAFVDRLIVAVAHHPTQEKSRLLPIRDRLELLRESFAGESRITVEEFEGLLVEFAKTRKAQVVVLGDVAGREDVGVAGCQPRARRRHVARLSNRPRRTDPCPRAPP
ncbi:MAG: adenylyltransferase/cytidyltransferase family protein, partial [Gemmatimonadota bacterium]